MKRLTFALILTALLMCLAAAESVMLRQADARENVSPRVVRADAFGISRPVRAVANEMRFSAPSMPMSFAAGFETGTNSLLPNAVHDGHTAAQFGPAQMPAPIISFEGISNADNVAAFNALLVPPDMNGDIGPSHYVQTVNSLFRVYDKTGDPLTPPVKLSQLFEPLGTPCSMRNDGLPIVLYDQLADRWLISQVCSNFPPFRQLIAVSRTGDPAGEFYLYEFIMPNVKINDFPKFGVWPDAYYMATTEFLGAEFTGTGAFAFDRAKMLAGDPAATYIYFEHPEIQPVRRGGLLPADIDGFRPPPVGTPNIFAGYTATEYGDAADAVRLFDFHADFETPENSYFTERPESPITVEAFDPTSPDGRADIAQPPPGEFLDSQSDRPAYRLSYRNHGGHSALVFNQTVRVTPLSDIYRAGIRVHELRDNGSGYFAATSATIGDGGTSRWIGSAAADHAGNIAVGYNTVNEEKQPSLHYSGRAFDDPANTFRIERTLVNGTGVQRGFGFRWGDYSSMSVDPADDCTFWMTGEYYTLESEIFSEFGWLTRIGTFKFPNCEPSPRGSINGTVKDSVTGLAIENARITASSYTRFADAAGNFGPMTAIPGTYEVTAAAAGYASRTITVAVANGENAVREFLLEPIRIPEFADLSFVAESCGINNAPDPGEAVTMQIAFQNAGARAIADLSAELLPTGGISAPSAPQNYGPVPGGGSTAAMPFEFTVDNDVKCGAAITLSFVLRDAGITIATVETNVRTGSPKAVFSEPFDSVTAPELPAGWLTSSSKNHQLWRTSAERSTTPANSLFSPSPHQKGVNEVISPAFFIETGEAELSFQNWYELETTFLRNRLFDGSVLEISIGGGEFADIIESGGEFISGGYDGVLDGCCQNPLAGRMAWSGRSGTGQESVFITTRVKLPPAAQGNSVRLRWRIGTDIGTFREGQYIDDIVVADGVECSCSLPVPADAPFDLDGDGRTDISVYRFDDDPNVADIRFVESSTGAVSGVSWGNVGDMPAFADFDGDGKTDIAVFRPSTAIWYILQSSDAAVRAVNFGLSGDVPVPADQDGDGRDDITVFRPSTGVWYVWRSAENAVSAVQFGLSGDKPFAADMDGDSKADIAVFRPSTGVWYRLGTAEGFSAVQFGIASDVPLTGDLDGDGKADIAVFRPESGTWYLLRSAKGFAAVQFGTFGDELLQADIDGDGRSDIGVYRPSANAWYFIRSSDGVVAANVFGGEGDSALPSIYVRP